MSSSVFLIRKSRASGSTRARLRSARAHSSAEVGSASRSRERVAVASGLIDARWSRRAVRSVGAVSSCPFLLTLKDEAS